MNKIYKELQENINKFSDKDIEIIQRGFIEARCIFEKISAYIHDDILKIEAKDGQYILLNINTMNGINIEKGYINMSLDNDSIIKLKAR